MSHPAPMNEQSYLRLQLMHQIIELGQQCTEMDKILGIDERGIHIQFNSQAINNFQDFVILATRSQVMIIEAKSLFATTTDLEHFLVKHMAKDGQALVARSGLGKVARYALQIEGDHHAQVARYLKHWYQIASGHDQTASLPRVRQMTEVIERCFESALDGHRPGLFKRKEFGDAYIQTRLFAAQADQQIKEIVEQCRVSDDHAGFWIDKLKASEASHPEDFEIFKTLITTQLMNLDIPGLEYLRTFILGSAGATGLECSKRMESMTRGILDRDPSDTVVDNHLQVITSNEQYLKDVMLEDFTAAIDVLQIHYRDNDRGDEFLLREKTIPQLTRVFKSLRLTPEQLAVVGMRVVAGYSRGQTRDMQNMPIAEQLQAIVTHVFEEVSHIREEHLQFAVMGAVVKSLPAQLLAPLAHTNDKARAAIYTLTGNSDFLAGIKDAKTIDNLMGADLGL